MDILIIMQYIKKVIEAKVHDLYVTLVGSTLSFI